MTKAKKLATLAYIYKLVYDTDYTTDDQRKLFYLIYLLHEKGLEISEEYIFRLAHPCGVRVVYCDKLTKDILALSHNTWEHETPVSLSYDAKHAISQLKELVNTKTQYNATTFIHTLATAYYLKNNICPYNEDKRIWTLNELNSELQATDAEENEKIYDLTSKI